MRIKTLTLRNFKGIREFTLDINGKDAAVLGDNRTGKTTIKDAFLWLLFGKDSQNQADFEIKTLDPDTGKPFSNLDHEVEAGLTLGDGNELSLKKAYKEVYTKKRGSATAEFTGHTTDYYVDGVPAKKKEYEAKVNGISDETLFRLITDPHYFNEVLSWAKRRAMLLTVCGDITDDDVINNNPKLASFNIAHDIDDEKKIIKAQEKAINARLKEIPARVDEANRGKPGIQGLVFDVVETELEKNKQVEKELRERLATIRLGGGMAEKKKQLAELEAVMQGVVNEQNKVVADKVRALENLKFGTEGQRERLVRDIALLREDKLSLLKQIIQENTIDVTALKIRREKRNNETLKYTAEPICPTCGQAIPEEQLQEALSKAQCAFNLNKAESLTILDAQIADGETATASAQEALLPVMDEIANSTTALEKIEAALAGTKRAIDAINATADVMPDEYQEMLTEENTLIDAIANAGSAQSADIEDMAGKILVAEEVVKAHMVVLAKKEQVIKADARIAELETEEKQLAHDYEACERQLFLVEEFIRTKVSLLEDKINLEFGFVDFKLFNALVNGGVEECCEATFQGVPYSSLNSEARVNAGLDIIKVFSAHHGVSAPVIIDNAESVTDLLPVSGQMIRLVKPENTDGFDKLKVIVTE